jgi:hypothetical protein
MAEDVKGGAGRRDEVGHTGIYPATGPYPEGEAPVITPAEINSGTRRDDSGVEQSDDLKGVEREPRKGDEFDPESDALGG